MSKSRLGLILLALVVAGAGCATTAPAPTVTPAPAPTPTANGNIATEVEVNGGLVDRPVIRVTDDGFDPKELTVKKGDTVLFVNEGKNPHWPASAPHPTHTNYPEFDPKTGIAAGQIWEFTFEKVGLWPFHDHLNPKNFGKVTVTE